VNKNTCRTTALAVRHQWAAHRYAGGDDARFKEAEVVQLAGWIADVLDDVANESVIERTRQSVLEICRRFPVTADPRRTASPRRCTARSARTRDQGHRLPACGRGQQVRRRRECLQCGERFTTFESANWSCRASSRATTPRAVRRKQAALGMLKALEKRPVASEAIDAAVNHVCHKLRTLGEREVPARLVANW